MFRFKHQRSVIAPLLLGGMILAGPLSMPEALDGLWTRLAAWLEDSSSGIDPLGRQ